MLLRDSTFTSVSMPSKMSRAYLGLTLGRGLLGARADVIGLSKIINMQHDIPPELTQAYKETEYFVHADPAFKMRIGQPCPELSRLMTDRNANCAAFITAWNPFSQQLSPKENEQRQLNLKAQLKTRGLSFIDGVGQHPSNEWPGEPSVLILNLNRESAKVLAAQYEQNAFVWIGETAVPELVQR